jgi:hypothetical protein
MADSELLAKLTSYFESDIGRQWLPSVAQDDWKKFCQICKAVGGFYHLLRGVKSGQVQIKLSVNHATFLLGTVSELNSKTTCSGCQSIVNAIYSLSQDLPPADTIQARVTSNDITLEKTSEISKKIHQFTTHDQRLHLPILTFA